MILVVEDHATTREALVRLLKAVGVAAVGVGDGLEALEFLQTHRPSLVVLDCRMPHMDGFECLAEIRSRPQLANLPVIMYSAEPSPQRQARALALGAAAFVGKGLIEWNDLLELIKTNARPQDTQVS